LILFVFRCQSGKVQLHRRYATEGLAKLIRIGVGIGATSSSTRLSSRLLLTMAFLRAATEEIETDFFEAPFFLLGSLFS
jgi:hypothetical protein